MQDSTPQDLPKIQHKCSKCKDIEFIIDTENNVAKYCECRERRMYERILERSGISQAFRKRTLANYKTNTRERQEAKDLATRYIQDFLPDKKSIAFLGQPGAGKTHLSIAIANALMAKNIGVLYFPYREIVTKLKQIVTDEEQYQRELDRYKTATVLLIDDLFKLAVYRDKFGHCKVNDADMRVMNEIINYRYLNELPMIVSGEYTWQELVEFDDATGSRIVEMCKNTNGKKANIHTFEGVHLNYRIVG